VIAVLSAAARGVECPPLLGAGSPIEHASANDASDTAGAASDHEDTKGDDDTAACPNIRSAPPSREIVLAAVRGLFQMALVALRTAPSLVSSPSTPPHHARVWAVVTRALGVQIDAMPQCWTFVLALAPTTTKGVSGGGNRCSILDDADDVVQDVGSALVEGWVDITRCCIDSLCLCGVPSSSSSSPTTPSGAPGAASKSASVVTASSPLGDASLRRWYCDVACAAVSRLHDVSHASRVRWWNVLFAKALAQAAEQVVSAEGTEALARLRHNATAIMSRALLTALGLQPAVPQPSAPPASQPPNLGAMADPAASLRPVVDSVSSHLRSLFAARSCARLLFGATPNSIQRQVLRLVKGLVQDLAVRRDRASSGSCGVDTCTLRLRGAIIDVLARGMSSEDGTTLADPTSSSLAHLRMEVDTDANKFEVVLPPSPYVQHCVGVLAGSLKAFSSDSSAVWTSPAGTSPSLLKQLSRLLHRFVWLGGLSVQNVEKSHKIVNVCSVKCLWLRVHRIAVFESLKTP